MATAVNTPAFEEKQVRTERPLSNGSIGQGASQDFPPKVARKQQAARKRKAKEYIAPDWKFFISGNHLGLLSLFLTILFWLYSSGWIPPIAKQTDVASLSSQINDIKSGVDDIKKEFAETRVEIIKASTAIARLEGRLEAKPAPAYRPRPPFPIKRTD